MSYLISPYKRVSFWSSRDYFAKAETGAKKRRGPATYPNKKPPKAANLSKEESAASPSQSMLGKERIGAHSDADGHCL